MMNTSNAGIALIKNFEGLELEAYQDIAGVWTIGYGHTGDDVHKGLKWTEEQATEALKKDLEKSEAAVLRSVSVELNQNEFDALVSFVYNLGEGNFRKSTLRKYINMGLKKEAAGHFSSWNKARVNGVLKPVHGLSRRRESEKKLFLSTD